MTSPAPTRRITPKHAEVLAASAISLEAAQAWGIFSVVSADELPADLAHFVFARGLVFPLRRPDDSVIHQIRLGAWVGSGNAGPESNCLSKGLTLAICWAGLSGAPGCLNTA